MADEVIEIPTRIEYLRRRVQPLLEEPNRTHILVGAAALAIGAGVGYLIGKQKKYVATAEITSDIHDDPNQMKLEFDSDELAEELAEMRELVDNLTAKRLKNDIIKSITAELTIEEDRESIEDLVIDKDGPSVQDFVERKLRGTPTTGNGTVVVEEEEPMVTGTIFAADDDDWNQELEEMQRSTTEPYILHKDEFYAEEKSYEQTTLTYYEGDNIMADQEDAPIYNHEKVTGPLLFGHGSGDTNVVYVRNDRLRAEYEIINDSGLFSVEVLGLDIPNNERVRDRPRDRDLRHSDFRKFRDTD